jgi:hypothetical protein
MGAEGHVVTLSVTRFLASSVSPLSAAGIKVVQVEMPATLALMFQ